jgi:hypothetical protein
MKNLYLAATMALGLSVGSFAVIPEAVAKPKINCEICTCDMNTGICNCSNCTIG